METLLAINFPELRFEIASDYGVREEEFLNAFGYIRDNKLIQDSRKLLEDNSPMRSSIVYPIIFPKQQRALNFEVHWIQGPMVYIGHLKTCNSNQDLFLARLYGMRIVE